MPKRKIKTKENLSALDKAYAEIEKDYGKDTIKHKDETEFQIQRYLVESPSLNYIFGNGIPQGRIAEFYGQPSGGKSSIATIIAGDIQRKYNKYVVYLDIEHTFDYEYGEKLGLDTSDKKFKMIRPAYGEEALNILETLIRSNSVDIIIIDSVAALVPIAEVEAKMEAQFMALQARLMSKALRKLTAIASQTNTTLIFINQIRQKVGKVWGSPTTTPGGEALKFYSSIRVDIRKVEFIKEGDVVVGIKSRIRCTKNKTAPPMREVEVDLLFETGLNVYGEYIDYGVKYEFINKAGAWYSIGDIRIGQGRNKSILFLKENQDVFKDLKTKVDNILIPSKQNKKIRKVKQES